MSTQRIVIKVGTNVLTDQNGQLDMPLIEKIVDQIVELKKTNPEIILVSSGAVGAGKSILHLPQKLNPITQRQVYSAVGQIRLMSMYQTFFENKGLFCAQVLATKEDFRDKDHFFNMKRCILALLRDNIIPVINENDVTSITELMFTDNDELACLTAALLNASKLVILSNVDGVLDGNGTVIPMIKADDTKVYENITTGKSSFGRGGMATKVRMCQKAAKLGIDAYIANGKKIQLVNLIIHQNAPFTHFVAEKKRSGIKKWMAYQDKEVQGKVVLNEGAISILKDNNRAASLLPIGITTVQGDFKKGDLVHICKENDEKIGIGMAAYPSKKLIPQIGQKGGKAFIHYDYLLIY